MIHDTLFKDRIFLLQLLNPSVDAPVTRLLQHIQSSLEEDDSKKSQFQITFKADAEVETTSCKLSINSELAGFPFVWKFYAMEAEKEMVCISVIRLRHVRGIGPLLWQRAKHCLRNEKNLVHVHTKT